jgi:uncharacterized protein (DUF2147 family)
MSEMAMKKLLPLALLLATLAAGAQTPAADPRGRWLVASGNLEVEVAPCGNALCGTVTRVIANRSMSRDGEMKPVDTRSPLGMQLLNNFVADGDTWTGSVYNREDGKTYSARMSVNTAGQLVLHAYVGLPIFGKTQHWQRVAADEAAAPQR